MAEHIDVTVRFKIKASTGTAALTAITDKMNALAPGRPWKLRPLTVSPANPPAADGSQVGPPWMFDVEVTVEVPNPTP